MSKAKIIFGIRDLPRPRGEGYIFCKFYPHYREIILEIFNLYSTEPEELEKIFRKALHKLLTLKEFEQVNGIALLQDYATDNMQEWAIEILAKVIDSIPNSPR